MILLTGQMDWASTFQKKGVSGHEEVERKKGAGGGPEN